MNNILRVGGVPEHFNLPWRLALDDDAFADTGVAVDYRDVPAGTGELTRQLRDDELDVALVLTEGAVADVVRHDANRLVKVYVESPITWGIHVAASSSIEEMSDARGKRVAISRFGSGSHLIAIVDAATRGWSTEDMPFVVVNDLQGARKALKNGEADVFLWERHMTQPLVDSGEFRRVGQREVPWPAFVASARKHILASQGNDIRSVLDVVANYANRLKNDTTAATLIAETYGIRLTDAEAWFAAVRWGQDHERPDAALLRAADALETQGMIGPGQFELDAVWHVVSIGH